MVKAQNEKFAVSEVIARWAYSEITEGTLSHNYDAFPGIEELRAKRREGRKFAELSEGDRYALAFQCSAARPNLMIFNAGVDWFWKIELTRDGLAKALVPPMVTGLPEIMSFEHYVNSTTHVDPKDARNVKGNPTGYQSPTEPLTIGRYYEHHVLIDGYHRAVRFWKSTPANATIEAFVPLRCER